MMPAVFEEGIGANCEYQKVVAELFHALSQPLTTLQLCLSGSLQKPQSAKGYRRDLQTALREAKAIVSIAAAIRQLVACEAGQAQPYKSDLGACVREVVDDLLPVAKSADLELSVMGRGSCHVRLESGRLRQALYYMVESALNQSWPGTEISIRVTRQRSEITLAVLIFAPAGANPRVSGKPGGTQISTLHHRLGLAFARRSFESAGGGFQIRRRLRRTTILIRLPRYQEPALPLARSSRRCG